MKLLSWWLSPPDQALMSLSKGGFVLLRVKAESNRLHERHHAVIHLGPDIFKRISPNNHLSPTHEHQPHRPSSH